MVVLAIHLHVVHRHVGVANEFFGRVAIGGVDRNADAGRDLQRETRQSKRRAQALDQLVRDARRILPVVQFRQQHREFVAAETRQRVAAAQAGLQAQGHLLQQLVSHHMAQGIVHTLEPVQIQEQHRQAGGVSVRLAQGQFQAVIEQRAVGQIRQRVVVGLMGYLLAGAFLFGDVAGNAIGAQGVVQVPVKAQGAVKLAGSAGEELMAESAGLAMARAEPEFYAAARAPVSARIGQNLAGPLHVVFVHELEEVPAQDLLPAVPSNCCARLLTKVNRPLWSSV